MTASTASVYKRSGRLQVTILVGALIFSTLLVAVALGTDSWFFGVLLSCIPVGVGLNIVLARESNRHLWDWLFWVEMSLIFTVPLAIKLTGRDFSFLTELILLLVMPALTRTMVVSAKKSSEFRWAIGFLASFLLIATISSILGRSQFLAAAYQFGTNLKYIVMILVGASMQWTRRSEAWLWRLIRWTWAVEAVFVAWQWIHPGSYFAIFWGAEYMASDPLGLLPSRALGTFQHPSVLAGISAILFLASWLRYLHDGRRGYLLLSLAYMALLFASTERQELAAAIIVAGVAWVSRIQFSKVIIFSALLIPVLAVVTVVAWPKVSEKSLAEAEHWGISGNHRIDHPRAVTYLTAATIANSHFPLGSGLGTFGGAGAKRFDDSYYWQLGFTQYYWFQKENFLMDTYWPNFYAEAGWFGLLAMMLSILVLIRIPVQEFRSSTSRNGRLLSGVAAAAVGYSAIVSLTSANIGDPTLFFIPAALCGISISRSGQRITHGRLDTQII